MGTGFKREWLVTLPVCGYVEMKVIAANESEARFEADKAVDYALDSLLEPGLEIALERKGATFVDATIISWPDMSNWEFGPKKTLVEEEADE